MHRFHELIKDQFEYGGKKYARDSKRESTDVLFDVYGKNWLLGTMNKYTFRFENLERERDLLKIATYCYIIWLKRGYHEDLQGLSEVIDTNVVQKATYFEIFTNRIEAHMQGINALRLEEHEQPINSITNILQELSTVRWSNIREKDLFEMYFLCFLVWFDKYSNVKEHDTDTRNEQKAHK